MDQCQQHFVSTNRHTYLACYKDANVQCESLCRSKIDHSIGPNTQQLSCAATAGRVVNKIQKAEKESEAKYDKGKNVLRAAFSTSDDTAATLQRFLSRQAARLETVNQ